MIAPNMGKQIVAFQVSGRVRPCWAPGCHLALGCPLPARRDSYKPRICSRGTTFSLLSSLFQLLTALVA